MTHVTCRLTAKNRDQLRNHALGNRVRAIPLLFLRVSMHAASALKRLSVCPFDRQQHRRAVGLLLSSGAGSKYRSIDRLLLILIISVFTF